jgi:hypothetical protein
MDSVHIITFTWIWDALINFIFSTSCFLKFVWGISSSWAVLPHATPILMETRFSKFGVHIAFIKQHVYLQLSVHTKLIYSMYYDVDFTFLDSLHIFIGPAKTSEQQHYILLAYTLVLSKQFVHYTCKFSINWLAVIVSTLNWISGKNYFH